MARVDLGTCRSIAQRFAENTALTSRSLRDLTDQDLKRTSASCWAIAARSCARIAALEDAARV